MVSAKIDDVPDIFASLSPHANDTASAASGDRMLWELGVVDEGGERTVTLGGVVGPWMVGSQTIEEEKFSGIDSMPIREDSVLDSTEPSEKVECKVDDPIVTYRLQPMESQITDTRQLDRTESIPGDMNLPVGDCMSVKSRHWFTLGLVALIFAIFASVGILFLVLSGQPKIDPRTPVAKCPPNSSSMVTDSQSVGDCRCNDGFYGQGGTSQCIPCPLGSTSFFKSLKIDDCFCNKGYTGEGGKSCHACEETTYKSSTGSGKCELCPESHYSLPASSDISQCTPASKVSLLISMGGDISASQVTDKVQTSIRSSIATSLVVPTSLVVITSIQDARRRLLAVNIQVQVLAPSPADAEEMTKKISRVEEAVSTAVEASTGTPVTVSATAMFTDPPNSPSEASICKAGYTKNNIGECVRCAAGKYKAEIGNVACTDCGAGKFSITSGETAEITCSACTANSDAPAGSDDGSDCTCNAGYWGPAMGFTDTSLTCTPCVAGKYRTTTGATTITLCLECPAGKYQGNDAASACTDCAPGTFSAAEGQSSVGTCIPCYASTDSSTVEGGGAAHTGCVCKAGYHQNAAPIAAGSTMTCTVSSPSLSPTHCSCAVAHTASVLASPCLESSVYDRDRVCTDAPRASELVYMHKHLLHTSPGLRRWHVSSHQRRHRCI